MYRASPSSPLSSSQAAMYRPSITSPGTSARYDLVRSRSSALAGGLSNNSSTVGSLAAASTSLFDYKAPPVIPPRRPPIKLTSQASSESLQQAQRSQASASSGSSRGLDVSLASKAAAGRHRPPGAPPPPNSSARLVTPLTSDVQSDGKDIIPSPSVASATITPPLGGVAAKGHSSQWLPRGIQMVSATHLSN